MQHLHSLLFIEGVVQLIIAIVIFIMIVRRGKNRMMSALGWFFVAVGVFSLGPFLPDFMRVIPGLSALIAYSSLICHTSVFFGMAGYCSMQLGLLRGSKIIKGAFIIGFTAAAVLLGVHFLSLDAVKLTPLAKNVFKILSHWTMHLFFVVSILFVVFIFSSLAWHLRKNRGALNSVATTGIGLGLMLVALMLRKILDAMMINHAVIDVMSFISLGLVVAGAILQMSSSMSPGFVFDAKTKKAIPLAIVRVFRVRDNKLLESRVTGKNGRYGLLIEPGEYNISVEAAGYQFPPKQKGVYRGEKIEIKKPTVLGIDIALDPAAK